MGDDERIEIIRSHVARLLEHFDSVEIFVTRQDEESEATDAFNLGGGNLYARIGQIRQWLMMEDDRVHEHRERMDREAEDEDEED